MAWRARPQVVAEIRHPVVSSSRGRVVPRGVKRTMSNFPLRPRRPQRTAHCHHAPHIILRHRPREVVVTTALRSTGQRCFQPSHDVALADIADYIDTFYNRTRRHCRLGGVSPEQFEAAHMRGRRRASA